jgi:membrane protein YqaA with SNARE-associated domain
MFSLRSDFTRSEIISYPTIFLLSFLGSGGMVVPVPSLAAVCTGTAILGMSPLAVALVAATAESLGEIIGYVIGHTGGSLIQKSRVFATAHRWMERWGGITLFLFAVIPNPFFDIAGLAAGALRYPVRRFLVVVWMAKLLKILAVGYACGYGSQFVINLVK